MKRGLFPFAGVLCLAGLAMAQQVVVRSPNGSECLKKGDIHEIKWGCVQCTGTAELHLVRVSTRNVPTTTAPARIAPTALGGNYQEIGVIKASIPINPGTQFYGYNWRAGDYIGGSAQPGDGYKILVRIVLSNGTLSDVSDSPFVIGAAPTIDTFAINDGLAVTEQKRVTLNYRFSGFPIPSKYRVRFSQSPGTLDTWSTWMALPTGSWPIFELPDKPGDYSIGLVLANDFGESPMKTDAISYAPVVPQKDYTINAATLACGGFPDMNPYWYSCRCTSSTLTMPSSDNCYCTSTGAIIVKVDWMGVGSKVEYEFFGGRPLNSDWSFVSINYSNANCQAETAGGSAILITPQVGSQNILFKVRLWTIGGLRIGRCEFRINSIVIRGPADQPISNAFK